MNVILETCREQAEYRGVVCLECIHRRWSYNRLEGKTVIEAAEKNPISKSAIAGIYYFKVGCDFVRVAQNAIKKGKAYEGRFYLSAAVNEMILLGKKVRSQEIQKEDYHTFYEPKQIEKYEQEIRN